MIETILCARKHTSLEVMPTRSSKFTLQGKVAVYAQSMFNSCHERDGFTQISIRLTLKASSFTPARYLISRLINSISGD